MQIEVSFLYRATGIRPRCRAEETVTLIGHEALEITELAAAEAPVAGRFTPAAGPANAAPVTYRAAGGSLMRPMRLHAVTFGAAPRLPDGDATTENLAGHLQAWTRLCLALGRGRLANASISDWTCDFSRPAYGPIEDERGFRFREWVSDSRAAAAARVRAAAAAGGGLVFVDGVLQQRSEGPCWIVRRDAGAADDGLAVRFAVRVDAAPELGGLPDEHMLFAYAASRRADAVAAAREWAQAARRPFIAEGLHTCRLEQGAPPQRDQRLALLAAARQTAIQAIEVVGKLPSQAIRAYADLKDAVQAAASDIDSPAVDALLPILRTVDAAWARHAGVAHPGGNMNPLRTYELRGVGDRGAAAIPVLGAAELEAMGRPQGRAPGR